jgi:FixJ family two-component response regulator
MDNDAGILPEDFILKPVRHTELLDWLERRLALTLAAGGASRGRPAGQRPRCGAAAPEHLAPLQEVVQLGFLPRHHEHSWKRSNAAARHRVRSRRHARAGAAVPVRGHGPPLAASAAGAAC